jgi:hypothetical protein
MMAAMLGWRNFAAAEASTLNRLMAVFVSELADQDQLDFYDAPNADFAERDKLCPCRRERFSRGVGNSPDVEGAKSWLLGSLRQ